MGKVYFKDKIKALRVNNNYTQRDFAKKTNSTWQTIQSYEYGNREPSLLFILELKKAFPSLDLNEFLNVAPYDKKPQQQKNK